MNEYKVGDQVVIVNGSRLGEPFKIETVTKVTATRIETNDKRQFMRNSGKLVGDSGYRADKLHTSGNMSVEEAKKMNAEWHEQNDARLRRNNVASTNWSRVPGEKIIRIEAILREGLPP